MEDLMEEKKVLLQGYKNSVLGLIPNDWEIKTLGQMLEKIVGGGTPSRVNVNFWNGNIPWATVKDLSNFSAFRTQEYITEEGLKKSSSNIIPRNTLITATRMALGKVVKFQVDVAINQDLKAIFPKPDVDSQFLYYWFQLNSKVIIDLGNGSTVKGIVLDDLRNIKFIKIPFSEQKAIADCLSTWDKSIEKMNQLIAQKELRKKGLMQELLTGKKRLSGFNGVWREKKMAEIFTSIRHVNDGEDGHSVMTISSKHGLISQMDKFDRVIAGDSLRKYTQIKKGDFAYNKGNSKTYQMGCIYMLEEKESALVPFVYICFSPTDKVCSNFYKHLFLDHGLDRQLKKIITSGARGDGLLNVSISDFFNLKIAFPTKEEQSAIAEIIESADKEIQLLKKKLEQLKMQKKGLMQVLLTGKKRLKY